MEPVLSFREWLMNEATIPWVTELLDGPNGIIKLSSRLTQGVRQDPFLWQQFRKFQGAIANMRSAEARGSETQVLEVMQSMQEAFHAIYNDLNDRGARPGSPYTNPAETAIILRHILHAIRTTFDIQTATPADSGVFPSMGNPTPRQQVAVNARR
jgi:hypothetical protein